LHSPRALASPHPPGPSRLFPPSASPPLPASPPSLCIPATAAPPTPAHSSMPWWRAHRSPEQTAGSLTRRSPARRTRASPTSSTRPARRTRVRRACAVSRARLLRACARVWMHACVHACVQPARNPSESSACSSECANPRPLPSRARPWPLCWVCAHRYCQVLPARGQGWPPASWACLRACAAVADACLPAGGAGSDSGRIRSRWERDGGGRRACSRASQMRALSECDARSVRRLALCTIQVHARSETVSCVACSPACQRRLRAPKAAGGTQQRRPVSWTFEFCHRRFGGGIAGAVVTYCYH
jgi:hypothetical protein